MADKFVVRQKKPDKKEDKSIVMTLRLDRELQEEFDALAAKNTKKVFTMIEYFRRSKVSSHAMLTQIFNLFRQPADSAFHKRQIALVTDGCARAKMAEPAQKLRTWSKKLQCLQGDRNNISIARV